MARKGIEGVQVTKALALKQGEAKKTAHQPAHLPIYTFFSF